MGLYRSYVLPVLVDRACRSGMSAEQRSRVIPLASGLVLEIGIGTGNTLPVYDPHKVEHITGLDPSGELWARRKTELADLDFEVDFIRGSAEWLPFEDASFDTVVSTFTLCSVRMVEQALNEMYRVLRPGGKFVYAEHGKAPDRKVGWFQDSLNPLWRMVSGGCNLNRDMAALIEGAGFRPGAMEEGYVDGWQWTSYHYWGWAEK